MNRRPLLSRGKLAICAAAALLALPAAAAAQEPAAVEAARRARDAGELDRAAVLLRQRLARAPDDVDARWLLAQTLYWSGELEAARSEYARALAARPGDPGLRLDFAGFLVDTGQAREAGRVLAPLAARPPPGWQTEIERVRRAVAAATAPWVRVAPAGRDDSQPLTRLAVEAEAGWWPAEGVSLAVRATPQRYEGETRETTATDLRLAAAVRRPGAPVSLELSGGAFTRSDPETTDAVGAATVAAHLPRGVALRVDAAREPYLWTLASLETKLLVDAVEVAVDRAGAPRWAFQAAVRRESFPDDNAVHGAWAWLLAPLLVREAGSFRAGYAFQWQDAEESRFTDRGVYDPYYTPEEVLAHSVVAAASVRASPTVSLHLDGSIGLAAEERVPIGVVVPAGGPPRSGTGMAFAERDFTPWRARASLVAGIGVAGELRAEVERTEDAFFELTRAGVSLAWRFAR